MMRAIGGAVFQLFHQCFASLIDAQHFGHLKNAIPYISKLPRRERNDLRAGVQTRAHRILNFFQTHCAHFALRWRENNVRLKLLEPLGIDPIN